MDLIKEVLKDKSPDYIEGFLAGIKLFAWWKNGVQYVGTCGAKYVDVLNKVSELLNERQVLEDPPGDTNPG